ncbi:MAG: hypothetical protein ABL934_17515 [Lysobacteraceae bacterium]
MTRFIRNDDLTAPETAHIQLTLWGIHGYYSWSYSNAFLILGGDTTPVEIELENATSDGSSAAISNYASTGVTEKHSPISAFGLPPGGNSAVFKISLIPGQLIDFGVFVTIAQGDHPPTTIFCDPQASNDPIKTPRVPPDREQSNR